VDWTSTDAARASAPPLSTILEALPLDPLTAVDDEDFLERMTKQQHLPEPIKQGLPLSTAHLCNDRAGFIVK